MIPSDPVAPRHFWMLPSVILAACLWLGSPSVAQAHCDTLSGPVVTDARSALDDRDVTPVLKWVKPEYEAQIRDLFTKTVAVRKAGGDAKTIADSYFFETVVRLHRAGEGAPFTGLTTEPVEAPVAAADAALVSGSLTILSANLGDELQDAIQQRFDRVVEAQKHEDESVEAGREYVDAYVHYVHFVEEVARMVEGSGGDAHQATSSDERHGH
jgi:hypothetical protein